MRRKKIYIADSYSLNTGDIAIMLSTLNLLRKHDVHVEVSHPRTASVMSKLKVGVFYPRIFDISKLVGSRNISTFDRFTALFMGAYDSLAFIVLAILHRLKVRSPLWAVRKKRRDQAKSILECDIWFSSGGGFISSHYNMEFRFYGFLVAMIMRKPVVIFAQSVGPFIGKKDRMMARFFLNRVAVIYLREKQSYEYVKSLNLKPEIHLTSDVAFSFGPNGAESGANDKVAICLKNAGERYEKEINKFIEWLQGHNIEAVVVSQTADDDELAMSLGLRNGIDYWEFGVDPYEVKRLYSECDFIVASRMHAIIFASSSTVPWVAIGYEPKFGGLVDTMNYPGRLLLNEKNFTSDELIQSAEYILANRERISQKLSINTERYRRDNQVSILEGLKIVEG